MTCRSTLELLSPELQRRILIHLESFDILHALILASPRIHQVFRYNKKAVLSKITRRRFSSTAIQSAVAIERLRQIEDPPFSRDTVLEFFSPAFYTLGESHRSILPLPVSTKLAKLDGTINFFIHDYTQNTFPILSQLNLPDCPAIKTDYKLDYNQAGSTVSRSESDRLRRAFCQFETYRHLFSRCSPDPGHDHRHCFHEPSLTAYEQAEKFFHNMPAYQAAEIACVRDYLHRRLRGVFDSVEDEVVQRLQAGCPNPRDKDQGLEWDYWASGRRHQFLENDEHYFSYSGKSFQPNHIEFLSSLGLPYVRMLLESSGDDRQDLLLRHELDCHAESIETGFITETLGLDMFSSNDELYGWYDRNIDSCLVEKSKMNLPPGWLWAHVGGYYHGVVDFSAKGLRDWGYVFWDSERLQKAGVLELDPRQVKGIEFNDYLASDRPSVQERWLGPRRPFTSYEDEGEELEPDGAEVGEELGG